MSRIDEGFDLMEKATNAISRGIDEFFEQYGRNEAATSSEQTVTITISSFRHRLKAAWKLIVFGQVKFRRKISFQHNVKERSK